MSNYDEDGFLGGKVQLWMEENVIAHQKLFDLAHELNRDCNRLLENTSQSVNEKIEGASLALFAGMVEIFQAIILVSKRGMTESIQILLRSFLEKLFHFTALQKDHSYLEEYINQFHLQRRARVNKYKNSRSQHLQDFRDRIDGDLTREIGEKIEGTNAKEVKIESVARRAELHELYVTLYDDLSRIAHSGVSSLNSYFSSLNKETGVLPNLTYGPSDREVRRAICFIGMYLPQAGINVAQLFYKNPQIDRLREYSDSFKTL